MTRRCSDEGSAVVEFVVLAVVLLVPTIYLVLTVATLQAASFAVATSAREAGRAFVTSPSEAAALGRARAAAHLAYDDHGLPDGTLEVRCAQAPCLSPDAQVDVAAAVDVPLPFVPAGFARVVPLSVRVEAGYVATVDRFREVAP